MSPPLQIQKPCKQKSPINCFYNVFVLSPILFHLEVVLWRDDVATASEGRTGSQRVFVIISKRILTSWKDCHHLNHATGALWFQHWHYHSHHYFCPHRYHSLLHHYSVIIVSSLLYHDDWMTLPLSSLLHHDNWMMSHLSSLLYHDFTIVIIITLFHLEAMTTLQLPLRDAFASSGGEHK